MRKHGIKLVLGYTVEGSKEKDNGVEVLLKDNPSLQADMVAVSYTHLEAPRPGGAGRGVRSVRGAVRRAGCRGCRGSRP